MHAAPDANMCVRRGGKRESEHAEWAYPAHIIGNGGAIVAQCVELLADELLVRLVGVARS